MGNPFVHLDLATEDMDAAKQFYGSVFDWTFRDMPEMKWSGIDVGDGVGGGMGGKQMPGQPTAWTPYVSVADVKETIARAEAAGATILVAHQEVPGMGWLGVFVDPQGATIGVWQSMSPPAAASDEVAAPEPSRRPRKVAKRAAKVAKRAAKAVEKAVQKAVKKVAKQAAKRVPAVKSKSKGKGKDKDKGKSKKKKS